MNLQPTHWRVSGNPEGAWLTLCHPIGSDRHVWESLLPLLESQHRVLAYDLRGHGQAPPSEGAASMDELAQDCLALWDTLGIARSHVLGLSLGGCAGLALARRAPERVQSLSVACARLDMDDAASAMWRQRAELVRAQGMEAIVTPTLERWFTPEFRAAQPALMARVAHTLQATSVPGYAACALALAQGQSVDDLRQLRMPVQYIAGLQDQAVPLAHLQRYHALTPGARWVPLRGPHLLHLENPGEFATAVLDFLRTAE